MTGRRALADAFAGKRVLVTGHTGFKGSWLALWLHELGADVTGFALKPDYPRSHFELLDLGGRIRHVIGDLRDIDAVRAIFAEARPEYVFHLAAQALVRRSYKDPKTTFDTNVGGSLNLLEAVRGADGIRALVYITSDKCYVNKEWEWGYRETDELGGHDPYSASKAGAEIVFSAYAHSFFDGRAGFGAATARAGNVIGGGDWAADRIVPDCIRALEAKKPIALRNPDATRPWQHVLDPLHGYLRLAMALTRDPAGFGGSWNFGPEIGAGLTVRQLAERAVRHWGGGKVEIAADAGPFEHKLLQLSIDKAKLVLGWRPRWDSERAIRESVDWYKQVLDGKAAWQVSRAQIAAFEEGLDD